MVVRGIGVVGVGTGVGVNGDTSLRGSFGGSELVTKL